MLPYYLKRVFWLVPTLVAVSIIGFLFLSLAATREAASRGAPVPREERRARFLDLPLFVNLHPVDVRERARRAARIVAKGDDSPEEATKELVHLGAAALPYVIPELDGYAPDERDRIALALAPLASRMHLPNADRAKEPSNAVTFWLRYWDDRGEDLQEGKARSAVDRLARYRTGGREAEVEELDTFALKEVIERLPLPETEGEIPGVRALTGVLSHVTEHEDRVEEQATLDEARASVRRWKAYWFVHASDFVTLDGTARASALVLETRYGKWASSIASSFTADGPSPALLRVGEGARLTFALLAPALAVAYVAGLLFGLLQAARLRRPLDHAIGGALLVAYAAPTALVAVLVVAVSPSRSVVLPVLVMASGLLAAPALHQRSGVATFASHDFIRAARARGAGTRALIFRHLLRFSLVPVLTVVPLELPTALGIAFVAERAFGLAGLSEMTALAVREHDVDFLMTLALCLAAVAALLLILTDFAHALLDPRMRHRLTRGRA